MTTAQINPYPDIVPPVGAAALSAVADLLAAAHTDLLAAAAGSADPDRFYEAASQLLAARARIDDAIGALPDDPAA